MIRVILTDIEGTTSSLSFVKDVLFPYARERMRAFLADHAGEPEVARELDEVNRLAGRELTSAAAADLLLGCADLEEAVFTSLGQWARERTR